MDILIIGGTRFLGRALAEDLLERGHNLTLFHRGKTNPDYLPEVEHVFGDRETDMGNLGDRRWDAVIDTCGYVPRIVKISVDYLKDKVDHYTFISSISVYKETEEVGIDESYELIELEDPTIEDIQASAEAYGGLKALCEQVVQKEFGEKALIIRPGLIIGPHDPTHRFTYWPVRVRRGGKILAPSDGSFPIQVIDVRDLASFTNKMVEEGVGEEFSVTGPEEPVELKMFLEMLVEESHPNAELVWVSNQVLAEHEVSPWMEMPLWIPSKSGEALMQVSITKALDHGITFRHLMETVKDTLDWYDGINGDEKEWPAGIDPGKEQSILDNIS